jgi:hypothetical protein
MERNNPITDTTSFCTPIQDAYVKATSVRVQINLRYDERSDADSPLRTQETRAGSSFRPRWLAKTNEVRLDVGAHRLSVKPGVSASSLFFPHPPTSQAFTEQSSFRSFENSRNVPPFSSLCDLHILNGAKRQQACFYGDLQPFIDTPDLSDPVAETSGLYSFAPHCKALGGMKKGEVK